MDKKMKELKPDDGQESVSLNYHIRYEIKAPHEKVEKAIPIPEKMIKEIINEISVIRNQKNKWLDILLNFAILFGGAFLSNLISIPDLNKLNIWLGFVGFGGITIILLTIFITSKVILKKQNDSRLNILEKQLNDILNDYKEE